MKKSCAVILVLFSMPLSARWAGPDDALTTILFEKLSYTVRRDGAYTVILEHEIEIRKEKARTDDGMFRMIFNPMMEKFELIRAETRNGTHVIPVSKRAVEIKPLASTGPGFDTISQVTVVYPDVKIGSKLYLKFKRTVFKAPYPGAFFVTMPFGWHENLNSLVLDFSSEVPLFHELVDGEKHFSVDSAPKHLRVTLKKPLYKMALEEDNPIYDPGSFAWLGVTTLKDWNQFPKTTVTAYESVISSALPEKFESILKVARQKTTTTEQINTVTSLLADSIRYVGDWRAVKGTFVPRSLKEVAATGYGDCKDFSSATGAILRRMGYEVHTALIARGADWIVAPLSIAVPDINHAILYVKKDGKELWIDPTNTTSFAQSIFTDIADRPTLVLHPNGAFAGKTPAMQASDGQWETTADFDFQSDGTIQVKGKTAFDGRGALNFTGSDLFNSKAGTDFALLSWLTRPASLLNWKVGSFSLKSRIVDHFETEFEYREKWIPMTSTAGSGYMMPSFGWLSYFRFKREDRVTNLNVGYPLRVRRNYKITGKQAVLPKQIQCGDKSPWADFNRRLYLDDGALRLDESIDFKMKVVPAAEMASAAFAKFQDGIIQCMQDALIVFR